MKAHRLPWCGASRHFVLASFRGGIRRFVPVVSALVCVLALGLGSVPVVRAQAADPATATLSGRVANAATGAYLGNAEVRLVGTDRVAITSEDGVYEFPNLPAGDVKVTTSYTGLDRMERTVTVPEGGKATLDFNLTTKQYSETVKMGAYVVAGMREGNAKAIVEQRRSVNIKNVISSDAFGAVSEDNLGEFLKYMPGLSINYNENDARTVSVRGLPSKYSSVTIDGNPVASADFAIGTGREFQFEQVSLSTIGTVEVNKTPLADLPANSLAGSINVKSKSAFDQKGRRISYSLNLTTNSYATDWKATPGWDNHNHAKTLPGGSLSYSDTLFDGRLGIVTALSHSGTYVDQKIIANLARTFDSVATNNSTEIPAITQVNWQDGPKPTYRDAALINLDFKVTPDMLLSWRTSYNYYNAPFHNRNWTMNAVAANESNLSASSMTTTATSAADTGNSITVAGTNFRKYGATFLTNPELNWKINDNVSLDANFSYSRSYQWYDSDAEGFFNIVTARMNGVSWGYTSTSGNPDLQVKQIANATSNAGSFFNIANYNSNNTAQTANRDAKDQMLTGRVDLTVKAPTWSFPTVFKFGADSRLLVKNMDTWTKVWSMNVNPVTGINLANYQDPLTPLNFHKGESFTDLTGANGTAPSLDKWRLYDLFQTYNTDPYAITTAAQQPFFLTAAQAAANLRNKLQSMFDFKETIQSAYAMGNITIDKKLLIAAGLRFEATDSQGKAFDDIGNPLAVARSGQTDTNNFAYIQARYGGRSTKEQKYNDFFPSLQARYNVSENLIIRGAYFRSILRPDPANIARSLVVNDTQTAFTDTNPDLKPEFAHNLDLRVEYYFEPVGVFSAGAFYKKIRDTQVGLTSAFTLDNVPQDIVDLGYTPANLVASGATFTRVTNGPENIITGLEFEYSQQLSFLPGAWRGLGVFANYTYTHPKDLVLFALSTAGSAVSSGIPKHAINAGINYKGGRFSGGVKVNWLGPRLLAAPGYTINATTGQVQAIVGANNSLLTYENERLQVDVNLEYQLYSWATVFLNGANVNDSRSIRYADHRANLIRDGGYGAKYTLGIKGTF